MMAKVINYSDTPGRAADLHPAFDAGESAESRLDLRIGQPAVARARRHRQRVADIQLAYERDGKFQIGNRKFGAGRAKLEMRGAQVVVFAETKSLHRAM